MGFVGRFCSRAENRKTPSQKVKVFALAGAIGIEPTQWESEAQVLPLHQAPSHLLLYIITSVFANTFTNFF